MFGMRELIAYLAQFEDVYKRQCREIMRSDCRTNLPGTALDSVLRLLSPLM